MAPTAIIDNAPVDPANLKAKVVDGHVELESTPPVADNYMYDFKYNHALPTLESLGVQVSPDTNAQEEAETLLTNLSHVLGRGDASGFTDLFAEFGTWKISKDTSAHYRCLARQAFVHLGLPNLQFQGEHR